MQNLRHLNSTLLFVALALWGLYFVSIDGGLKAPPVYDLLAPQHDESTQTDAERWLTRISEADAHYANGRYDLAKPLFDDALEQARGGWGNDHPNTATSLDRLGITQVQLGNYEAAETLLRQALSIREDLRGVDHSETASSMNNLAGLFEKQNRLTEAESLYHRAIKIDEATFGRNHLSSATAIGNLASLFSAQSRFDEAEKLFLEVIDIRMSLLDPMDASIGEATNNLAVLYLRKGQFDRAYPLLLQALEISEHSNGKSHPQTAAILDNMAGLQMELGDYIESERIYRRALSILERSLGGGHPSVAHTALNLGMLFERQGRLEDAERFLVRALSINETALGENHVETGRALNNLARVYQSYGMLDEADPLYWRAYNILAEVLGEEHPRTATTLNNWAVLSLEKGDYERAEQLLNRTLLLQNQSLEDNHPSVAETLNNLASVYQATEQFPKAEESYTRSIEIKSLARGPTHPSVAIGYNNLAFSYFDQDRIAEALDAVRRSSDIFARRAELNLSNSLSDGARSEFTAAGSTFQMHSAIAWRAARKDPTARQTLEDEAFISGQKAEQRKASDALSQLSARFQAGANDVAELARERQDLINRWRANDELLTDAFEMKVISDESQQIAALRIDQEAIAQRLEAVDDQIATQFPSYAEISSPMPLSINQAQKLLSPDEALVFFLIGQRESYVWAIRKNGSEWHQLSANRDEIAGKVEKLRKDLVGTCCGAFDLSTSHALYDELMSPIEVFVEGINHLIVVPSGPLQSLPFSVLTTQQPNPNYLALANYEGYRQASWLIKSYAVTTLPAVSSLNALRTLEERIAPSRPFIGFGNPTLSGSTDITDRAGLSPSSFFRGTRVDVTQIRQLSPLEESADELAQIAETLGAPQNAIYVGDAATETTVKAAALHKYRVLSFATHGLVAGELNGLAEPALVLTPPDNATTDDDGLLTASEVALLKLNADWVLLSACNTAAGESLGAEPLSGLAKAFFYAGTTSLLVSHWPVQSDAAVALTTGTFRELAETPSIGKSEALRRSMLAVINETSKPANAHPSVWAPFVIIGEGN